MTETSGMRHSDQPDDASPHDPYGGPQQEPPKKRTGKRILFTVIGIAVAAVVAFGVRTLLGTVFAEATGDLSTAEAGDCIDQQPDINDVKVVACDSAEAAMTVIGVNQDWTENDFDAATLEEVCEGFTVPDDGGAIWYGEVTDDGTGAGDVYCLEPLG